MIAWRLLPTWAKALGATALAIGTIILGKRRMEEENPRVKVVKAAASQLGVQDPNKYWAVVQPGLVNSGAAWCGGFALWALKQAGLVPDLLWKIGKGFTAVNGLPTTRNPQPGDIAYFDQPYQHHAIVTANDGQTVHTIDGNQPGNTVATRSRPLSAATAYYSIQPFIG